MAYNQRKFFSDISENGNPVIMQDYSDQDYMLPQDNLCEPIHLHSIVNFHPILPGCDFEDDADVPFAELQQSLINFNSDVNLRQQNDSETNAQGVVQITYLFDTSTYGSPVHDTPPNCPQKCGKSFTRHIESTIVSADSGNASLHDSRSTKELSTGSVGAVKLLVDQKLRSCDDRDMKVQTSDQGQKKYFCKFCKKFYGKLPRHLEAVHKDEDDVKKFLESAGKERRRILDDLRKTGGFEVSTDPKYKNKFLQVSRRPSPGKSTDAERFKVCFKCRGFYVRNNLRHHVRTCSKKVLAGERVVQRAARVIERRIHVEATENLIDRLSKMTSDEISGSVMYDWLLVAYGNNITKRFKKHYQHKIVRQKLRLASRLLQQIKSCCAEISDFASIYHPKYFDHVVHAIRMVGSFNEEDDEYGAPSTSAEAVTLVRELCKRLVAEYIKRDNAEAQRVTENFLKLFDTEISDSVNKPIIEAKAKMRLEKEDNVPTTSDVNLFAKCIEAQRKLHMDELMRGYSLSAWKKLSEATIASIIVFNKRRVGEIQNMTVDDFHRRKTLRETSGDLFENLSAEDKKIADRYSRVVIREKLRTPVPVLFKPGVEESIKLLLKYRLEAGVLDGNNCLFALPSKILKEIRVVNAGSVLRKLSTMCGAKNPESLRGTNIRKHMASVAITLELGDGEVSELSDYMGHREDVHRKHYRINPIERQVVKMSQLLEAATGSYEDDDIESHSMDSKYDDTQVPSHSDTFPKNTVAPIATVQHSTDVGTANVRKRKKQSAPNSSKVQRKRWNKQDESNVYKAFASYMEKQTVPSIGTIENIQTKCDGLKNRSPAEIRGWICDQFKKA